MKLCFSFVAAAGSLIGIVAALEPTECTAEGGSVCIDGPVREEQASLLQLRRPPVPELVAIWPIWKVATTGSLAASCDEICQQYGMLCTQEALRKVNDVDGVMVARHYATGTFCDGQVEVSDKQNSKLGPYIDLDRGACVFPDDHRAASCGARAPKGTVRRLCPCRKEHLGDVGPHSAAFCAGCSQSGPSL
mmetsp:Transcript_56066/g.110622  ORF Transcript_56066/g.110622 Transcript_56066/m.110622 type:complete len:191 (-) Transcript_56066:241-813(-)